MKIPEKGMKEWELFKKLEAFRKDDIDWAGGRMFGHAFIVNPKAREIVEKAYTSYLWENALDPTLFPSLMEMENEVLEMARVHLRGDENVVGSFTSGGTESIMLAVKSARDKARAEKPEIETPEMILPVTAHAAFHKAAHYFGVKTVLIPVNKNTFKAEAKTYKEAITENTVILVASAPSYAHGVLDEIPDIGSLAEKHDLLLHIDGCMGAFLASYFRKLGARVTDFDFAVPGVTSISMDFHKYAFAAKGASVVLYRDKSIRKHQIFACSDWTGYTIINPTIQSSRSGGPLAGVWAVLNYMGEEGYLEVTRKLKDATDKILKGVQDIDDIYVLGEPEMCFFSIGSDTIGVFHIVDEMKLKGWHVQAQMGHGEDYKENFHVTIVPPTLEMIDLFLKDLKECVDLSRPREPSKLAKDLAGSLADGPAQFNDEDVAGLFAAVGIKGDELPERMAEINEILNALPPDVADELFVSFYNEVNRYHEKK